MDILKIKEELNNSITDETERIIVSNPIPKEGKYRRLEVKKMTLKNKAEYQLSCYTEKQVFQINLDRIMLTPKLLEYFPESFTQMNIFNQSFEKSINITKKVKCLQI